MSYLPVNILRCRDKRRHNPQLLIERFPLANCWMTSTPANDVIREGIDDRRSLIRGQFPVVGQNLSDPLSIGSLSSLSYIHFI